MGKYPAEIISGNVSDSVHCKAVLDITASAFMINPETGLPIEEDTPKELPLVQAFFERNAADYLFLARLDGKIVGYILYCKGSVTENPDCAAYALMIMGVYPEYQKRGVGTALLTHSVECLKGKADLLFVIGHPGFYPKAGFVTADSLGLSFTIPAPKEVCMAMNLSGTSLLPGVINYPPLVNEFC